MNNFEVVAAKTYATLVKGLQAETQDERIAALRKEAEKIFLFNSEGKIVVTKRGRYVIPEFDKLYVMLNLRKVGSFLAALIQYVLDDLAAPNTYNKIDSKIIVEDEEAERNIPDYIATQVNNIVDSAEKDTALDANTIADVEMKIKKTVAKKPTKKKTTRRKPRTTKTKTSK